MPTMIRRSALAALALATGGLGACSSIVHDTTTNTTASAATYTVTPIEVPSRGGAAPALEVVVRRCNSWEIVPQGIEGTFRPALTISDHDGKVVFHNFSVANTVIPPGAKVVDGDDPSPDRVTVPVDPSRGPFRVEVSCTTYPGAGSGPWVQWLFTGCTTVDMACGPVDDGGWQQVL